MIRNPREVSVHHSPASVPLSERLTRLLDLTVRFLRVLRPGVHRGGRMALGALVSTVLTALALSVPMVSGAAGGTPFVALDSFASTSAAQSSEGDSPVVMGRDGEPVSSATFAGVSTSTGAARRSSTDAFGAPPSTAPAPTPAAPTTAVPAAPAPADAPKPTPTTPTPTVAQKAPAAAPAPAVPADPGAGGQVLALVNVQRAAAGCGALTAAPALATLARAHSADMRDRHFFDHVNPDGLDPFQRAARAGLEVRAENIAQGQPDAAAVMDAWMKSPGHRANILDCSLKRLGVGVAEGPGGPWWTQDFD